MSSEEETRMESPRNATVACENTKQMEHAIQNLFESELCKEIKEDVTE
jgi:hypothetical protein